LSGRYDLPSRSLAAFVRTIHCTAPLFLERTTTESADAGARVFGRLAAILEVDEISTDSRTINSRLSGDRVAHGLIEELAAAAAPLCDIQPARAYVIKFTSCEFQGTPSRSAISGNLPAIAATVECAV